MTAARNHVAVTRPLPQSTLDRLLTTVSEGYRLTPLQTVQVAKFLESNSGPKVVVYDVTPAAPTA